MISGRLVRRSVAVLLAVVTVIPVGSAAAEPGPNAAGVEGELVPGESATGDELDAVETELRDAADRASAFFDDVPVDEEIVPDSCPDFTGPYQRQVERYLKLKVDGKQSERDCDAIRAFQEKQGIEVDGYAGPLTWAWTQVAAAKKNPNAAKKCPVRTYRVACVDLSRQLTWVQKGKKVVFGPVPMRSGRAGHRTRVGWHTIHWRHKNHYSTLYKSPMPYAQFFSGGQAFHAVHGTIFTTVGSRGCVSLRHGDARKLWGLLKKGDRVYVWGRRPI
ncbi:L,D-transpeptidase family protein [Streptomyces sp. NPDC002814]